MCLDQRHTSPPIPGFDQEHRGRPPRPSGQQHRLLIISGSSLNWVTFEMQSSAKEGQVVFSGYLSFHPPLINDGLDKTEIILKGL